LSSILASSSSLAPDPSERHAPWCHEHPWPTNELSRKLWNLIYSNGKKQTDDKKTKFDDETLAMNPLLSRFPHYFHLFLMLICSLCLFVCGQLKKL
jgi:hypothetical protein